MYRVCQSEEGDISSHTGTSGELHQSNKKNMRNTLILLLNTV